MEGHCQCGLIRFTTPTPAPTAIFICHCTQCRHQSSSAFGITCSFPAFTIKPPVGNDQPAWMESIEVYTRITKSGRKMDGYFCTRCGSRLMHRIEGKDVCSIKGGCLVALDREMMRSAVHIWTGEAVVEIPEGCKSFVGEPEEPTIR